MPDAALYYETVGVALAFCAVIAGLRRALRTVITVSEVNRVWVARVTGVFGSRQYVRVEKLGPKLPLLSYDRHDRWLNVHTGAELRSSHSVRADQLVELEHVMRKLREVPS